MMKYFYVNREWVRAEEAFIPLNEAGFLRGDGIFESFLVEDGYVFRLEDHLNRLFEGVERIRINMRETKQEITGLLGEYARINKLENALVRLIITRGIYEAMPWNYDGHNSIYITHSEVNNLPASPAEIVFFGESHYPLIRAHPALKSLNYLGNMLAKMDAYDQGAFEPVLYNADGYITEGGIRNIFFVQNGKLMTPPIHLGILPGTMREAVIEVARQEGIHVEEELIPYKHVDEMDEAFLTSTTLKILPVFWKGWESDYHVTHGIQKALNELIKSSRKRMAEMAYKFTPEKFAKLEEKERYERLRPQERLRLAGIDRGDNVLDIGAGTGFYSRAASAIVGHSGSVLGIDILKEMVEKAKEAGTADNLEYRISQESSLPVDESSFDWAIMTNLFHELEDPDTFIKELNRVLKPDGSIYLTDWIPQQEDDGPPAEHRIPAETIIERYEKNNFRLAMKAKLGPSHYELVFDKKQDMI